jgi:DNA-binding XRE family transcriptional regulator
MPPAQVQELVAQVKAWYETHEILQRDLAAKLGVSPTGLCQIFAGINKPSASTALAMIRFLEEQKTMKTNYLDPRTTPRQAAGNPGPKTLTEARERIETLEAQLVQLRGAAPKPILTVPAPTKLAGSGGDSSPTFPKVTTPGADQPNKNQMATNFPAIVRKALPPEANTPVLIQRILDVTTLDDLCSMLDNPIHTPTQQSCIYVEVKKRRNLVANRFQ